MKTYTTLGSLILSAALSTSCSDQKLSFKLADVDGLSTGVEDGTGGPR